VASLVVRLPRPCLNGARAQLTKNLCKTKKNKKQWTAVLDKQCAELSQRAREHKMQETRDANELKLRTTQQFCREFAIRSRQKQAAKLEDSAMLKDIEAKRLQQRANNERENEAERLILEKESKPDDSRLQARKQRLEGAQAHIDANARLYERTALKEDRARAKAEDERVDRDEQRFFELQGSFYARREHARHMQQRKVNEELDQQVAERRHARETDRAKREVDLAASRASTRQDLDKGLQTRTAISAERLQMRNDLLAMVAEKEHRYRSAGMTLPIGSRTMWGANANANSKATAELAKQIDAPRFLWKPLGRAETTGGHQHDELCVVPLGESRSVVRQMQKVQSQTDIADARAGGGIGPALERWLAKETSSGDLCSRTWSEGLSSRDLRAAQQVANKRTMAFSAANNSLNEVDVAR